MDIKEIKQIIELMKQSELSEFEIEREGLKLRVHRQAGGQWVQTQAPIAQPIAVQSAPVAAPAAPKVDDNTKIIKSPMVGTFYASASPDSPAFVKIGSTVTKDTTVCIIEAMKVMNEIQAELSGTITEVLIQNGQNVEYGQPIFKVTAA